MNINKILTSVLFISVSIFSQNITNTLGTSGLFKIKDASTDFLSLSQSTGYLSLNRSLTIRNTTSSTLGVIFMGADRFIHNYAPPGADGFNTFVGINSGNFTMTAPISYYSSYNTGLGILSLNSNTTGFFNTAVGFSCLESNTTGYNNTALGFSTGTNVTTGSNLTLIGYDAEPTTGSAINQITLGNGSVTSLRCIVTTITSLSDMRDKKNIKDLSLGLDFISCILLKVTCH